MRVCVAQVGLVTDSVEERLRKIKDIIVSHRTADLIVFPELILHGHPSAERPEGLLHRRVKAFYRHASREFDLHNFVRKVGARVILGDLKQQGNRYYNLATYIDGDQTKGYVKTHVHWTENFVAGRNLNVFDSPFGKMGLTICFDAAFPEVMRVMALNGAVLLVNIAAVPASFPVRFMWRRLQASALNNQVFVIYCNRPGDAFSGHSAVFDPRGDVVTHSGSEEGVFVADLDLAEVDAWRAEEPIYMNRRPLLYRLIARQLRP
jgi:predicted amidohydrolase